MERSMMSMRCGGLWLSSLCGLALAQVPRSVPPARADDYPSRPITVIVPFPPGGSSDIVMRLVAHKVSESIKQTIIIDNRPGGAGNVAAMAIKNAPPDGYLLMMGHTGTHAINPSLYTDLKFDPVKDFQPITALISFNNILVVPAASPAKSVAELVALAKIEAGRSELRLAGRRHRRAPARRVARQARRHQARARALSRHRAGGDRHRRRAGGHAVLLLSLRGRHIESGRLRMLAIAGTKRHPRIPDVPTMPEAGYPDVQMQQWFGLFAPAGTPAPIVHKLNAEFVKALQSDEVKNKVLPQVAFVIPGTPEELGAMVARDMVAARQGGARSPARRCQIARDTDMSLEYAPRGLVGMLTPQANTTVEPEFNLLWPPGVAMINARLMSDKSIDVGAAGRLFRQLRRRRCGSSPTRRSVSSARPAPARPIWPDASARRRW